MRDWLRLACIGAFASAAAAGCTLKNVNVPPAELMRQVQAGEPMLDCRAECSGAWGQSRQQVRILDATGRWQDLALLVAQIGYMNDLSYYYLGRAAENLGYWQAAQRYYRIAERLSVGPMSCHQGEVEIQAALSIPADLCDGYSFPDALYPHLEVVEARLAALSTPTAAPDQQRTRRAVRHQVPQASTSRSAPRPGQTPTPASATGSGAAPSSGFVEPAPAAASSSTDFFEPPPVRR
ncbi:MAG TPA: hypothetical protein VKF83_08945 [Stellaceae bacterium]|nr:hypothetical protein [Stellaceae bacterium]